MGIFKLITPFLSLIPKLLRLIILALFISIYVLINNWLNYPAIAKTQAYCQFTQEAIATKENLLQASLQGDSNAQKNYNDLLKKHAEILYNCRLKTWPNNMAIWLRLYPCDVRLGLIDKILDRLVNRGYNQVNLEVFFDGQVLLPPADNPTPWVTVVRPPSDEKIDLLAEVIKKGHQRGLKVYAWLFTMNFGTSYSLLPERQQAVALNGKGQNSISFVEDNSQLFIDPYHPIARSDYYQLLQAILRRHPDGVLFDYVRYPRGTGTDSVVDNVKDLWIYGKAAQEALEKRANNAKGLALIKKYVSKGEITSPDVEEIDKLYPKEIPMWQGREPLAKETEASVGDRQSRWQLELWYLCVAHAAQGVLDFLHNASSVVQSQGIPQGAVFFPEGNQVVGETGFDSRLQAWDRFSPTLEWHPMSYGVCGKTDCIVEQVKRVISMANPQTEIKPVIAGLWGQAYDNRPSLEQQMLALRQFPQIKSVSHFAYSWQDLEFNRARQFCNFAK